MIRGVANHYHQVYNQQTEWLAWHKVEKKENKIVSPSSIYTCDSSTIDHHHNHHHHRRGHRHDHQHCVADTTITLPLLYFDPSPSSCTVDRYCYNIEAARARDYHQTMNTIYIYIRSPIHTNSVLRHSHSICLPANQSTCLLVLPCHHRCTIVYECAAESKKKEEIYIYNRNNTILSTTD